MKDTASKPRDTNDQVKRIQQRVEELGMTMAEFKRKLGVSQQAYNGWTRPERKIPSEKVPHVAKIIGKTEEWVRTGKELTPDVQWYNISERTSASAPLINWDSIVEYLRTNNEALISESFPCPIIHGDRTFITVTLGESMKNNIDDSTWLFVDPDEPPSSGKLVLARVNGEKNPVLRKYIKDGAQTYLQTDNAKWPEPVIKIDDSTEIIGTVIFKGSPA